MLPCVAVDNLVDAVFKAVDLAGQGEISEGYRVLLRGRQSALEGEQNFAVCRAALFLAANTARDWERRA